MWTANDLIYHSWIQGGFDVTVFHVIEAELCKRIKKIERLYKKIGF